MRRVGLLFIGAWGAVVLPVAPAAAAPAPSPSVGAAGVTGTAAPTGQQVCAINDSRLVELSGLVALPTGGYVVANDSNDQASAVRVFYLDSACKVTRTVAYPPGSPARDPEDLAVASDGTVWVADIGDNFTNAAADRRDTIALWRVPTGGGTPVIYRLAYPDGPHDAEALLFGASDVPLIVTKDPGGTATIYQPTGPLQPNTRQGVPLRSVGTWKPKATGTPNFLGAVGQILVTGAAQSPDRKRFVLRTYSDAYEWDVPDGDIVKALKGTPRITSLPGEAQGEAIAYSSDGASFLTCTDQIGASRLLRYRPTAAITAATTAATAKKTDTRPWYRKLTLPQLINLVAGVGVLGLVLVVIGLIGIRRSRKTRRRAALAARDKPVVVDPAIPESLAPDKTPAGQPGPDVSGNAVVGVPESAPRTGGATYGGGTYPKQPGRGGGNIYGGGNYGSGP